MSVSKDISDFNIHPVLYGSSKKKDPGYEGGIYIVAAPYFKSRAYPANGLSGSKGGAFI